MRLSFLAFACSVVCHSLVASQASAQVAGADRSADATATALQQTQSLLANPQAVAEYEKTHPDAAKANANVQTLTGGNTQDTASLYKLAADIFENVVKESNGDPAAMSASLAQAMKNPQGFADKLTSQQQTELKSLTQKIESRAPTSAPH